MKVVYMLGTYPILTTTFIDRELLEARRLGLDMLLVAIRRARSGKFSPAVQELMGKTVYLLPVSILRLTVAHLYYLFTRSRVYFGTLWYLLTREHPSLRTRGKTLLHFGEGILAAFVLRDREVGHVHAHFADRASVVAMVIGRLLGISYSLTAHAVDIYVAPAFLADKIKDAKFATTCTRYNKSYLERQTGHKVELIYHVLDFGDIERKDNRLEPPAIPLILSVGQLKEKKGFSYLINACALLRAEGFEFVCEIIGDGPESEKLNDLINDLGLADIVILRGALPHEDVLRKYSTASLFALACVVANDGNRDGIPNVILEAMAYGLPVVSTDVSGVPEVVRDAETGWLVESRNAKALSAAVARVLLDPEEAAVMGRNASNFVRRQFDIRQNVKRLIEMFSD